VGIYNVGYRVGSLVTLVAGALQLAYPRFLWSIYNEKPNPKDYFEKINTYFYLITFSFALGVSVFAKEAIQVLTGSAFHSSYIVVPLIAFSYVAYALYQNFGTGVAVMKKTYLSAIATFVAGALNLLLNYVLISRFGMMGAAVATLLSFTALALIELQFSQRVYKIPFEFKKLFIVLMIGGVLVYASTLINLGLVLSLVVKAVLVLSFPVLLLVFGFFEERELKKLAQIWLFIKKAHFHPKKIFDGVKQEMIT
jgi:O-antigen/teichoic acid export membrane protein